jgi:ribosomal protein L40E
MKKSDFQLIGYIGLGLGVMLLIGAVLAYSLANMYLTPSIYYDGKLGRAYLNYSVILGVFGIISLITGLGFLWRARQETTPPAITEKKYCRFCGSENKSDASYCVKCGKPLG